MYQQFFVILKQKNTWKITQLVPFLKKHRHTSRFRQEKLQLLIFQPSSCWPFLKKANIAIYQNYPEMDFVRRYTKSWMISYFSIPIFEYRVSYFFGTLNIAVSSEYYRLCSPRSYNFIHPSNGWVEYSNRIRGKCRKMGRKYDSDYARDIYHSAILLGVASSDK